MDRGRRVWTWRESERMSNVVIKKGCNTEREMNGAESRKIGQEAGSE